MRKSGRGVVLPLPDVLSSLPPEEPDRHNAAACEQETHGLGHRNRSVDADTCHRAVHEGDDAAGVVPRGVRQHVEEWRDGAGFDVLVQGPSVAGRGAVLPYVTVEWCGRGSCPAD